MTRERYSTTSDPGQEFAESLLFVILFCAWMTVIWMSGSL